MPFRESTRAEARLWLGQFNQAYSGWLRTECTDPAQLHTALRSLHSLAEREPEAAETVSSLVVTVLFNGHEKIGSAATHDWVEFGLQADRLIVEMSPARQMRQAWLHGRHAEAMLAESRWAETPKAARDASDALRDMKEPLAEFLRAWISNLEGTTADACLDVSRARASFAAAEEHVLPFLDQKVLGPLVLGTAVFVYGEEEKLPREVIGALLQRVWRDVAGIVVSSSIGLARADAMAAATNHDSAARALQVIERLGVGRSGPLELAAIVRWLEPAGAQQWIEVVLKQADKLRLDGAGFRRVLCSAAAAEAAARGGDPGPMLRRAQVDAPIEVLLDAVALGFEAEACSRARQDPFDLGRRFVEQLRQIEGASDPRLRNWRIRSLLDRPLQAVLRDAVEQLSSPAAGTRPAGKGSRRATRRPAGRVGRHAAEENRAGSVVRAENRRMFSNLVDCLQEDPVRLQRLMSAVPRRPGDRAENTILTASLRAEALAADRLGRIEYALRSWPDAVALILRDLADETVMICATAAHGTEIIRAGPEWRAASRALRAKVAHEIDILELTHTAGPPEEIRAAGVAAYTCLPERVRDRIAEAKVMLICPDHRSGGDGFPYELLHDGADWIGLARIVARLPSVRALARCVEGAVRRDVHRRFLALAVPEAEAFPVLKFAADEVAGIRSRLSAAGWDAPPIEPGRITPAFLLERLPFVTHLHISAHGQDDELSNHLVLAGGSALYPEELREHFFPTLPAVFLNTCSLGTSHYLGGGLSQGVAHAFIESGAPAVVANLLPVDDASSSGLANAFYDGAPRGFGVALQEARRRAADAGAAPILWGSAILIGDPRITLVPQRTERLLSERLLDAYFSGAEAAEREPVRAEADEKLARDPGDIRLQAAADLLREIASWPAGPTRELRPAMLAAFRTARELNHLPTAATIAWLLAETFDDAAEGEEALAVIEDAINLIEPIEHENKHWKGVLDRLLVRWLQLRRGDRRVRLESHGPSGEQDRQLGEAVLNIQLALEARALRRGDAPRPVPTECTERDVLWNAILASRAMNFEDMPETFAFAAQIAGKLVRVAAIPSAGLPFAAPAIAGFLEWLWSSQHVADLPRELAEGQVGSLGCLVRSLRENWPPSAAPWLQPMRDYPAQIKLVAGELETMPYDEKLYQRMNEIFAELTELTTRLLDEVGRKHPAHVPDAAAWILGCLIQCNTFSYLEGSVPESIGERLKAIHDGVANHADGFFGPWLAEGFAAGREHRADELERWKYGLLPEEPSAAAEPAHPGASHP